MQSGIALAAWLLLHLFQNGIRNTAFFFLLPFGPLNASRRAVALQQRIRPPARQRAALLSALVDFQKVQCFFTLSIQAAALVAVRNSGIHAKTSQEYVDNVRILAGIAVAGYLPVTFVLLTLHDAGMKSGYVLVLSIFAAAASSVTTRSLKVAKPTIEPLDGLQCGLHQRPVLHCPGQAYDEWVEYDKLVSLLCWITFTILLVDMSIIEVFRLTDGLGGAFYAIVYEVFPKYAEKWSKWRRKFYSINAIARLSPFFNTIFLFFLCGHLKNIAGVEDSTHWTFGQIVAVTIFAPPLIEYIYFVFCKYYLNRHMRNTFSIESSWLTDVMRCVQSV